MQKILVGFVFVLAAGMIFMSQSLYTVDETEQAIVLQFGQPIGTEGENLIKTPGLHFKLPFIQQVRYFDSRILSVDPAPERMNISSDDRGSVLRNAADGEEAADLGAEVSGEPILVDSFARYRITDPLAFLKTLQTVDTATTRIGGIMSNATRNVLGQTTLREILSEKRSEIMNEIRETVNAALQDGGFGVEIVDIRIVRADLTDKLRTSTVNRMITERRERATETRAKGRELALEIRSKAEKERTIILAEANKKAQIIRGEGDRTAIKTYTDAYNKDPDFYSFLRSMEAYENSFGEEGTQLILSPDSAFLRYLRSVEGR